MAQVTLRINGYSHTLVCKDGEENHLLAMANEVEQRIEAIKAAAGQSGESRMLVMAALMMADDLFELRKRVEALESGQPAPAVPDPKPDTKLGRRRGRTAKRAEELAADLDSP